MKRTSLPMSRKAVTCKLPAFPGRKEHSKAAESEELYLSAPSTPSLSAATLEAAWSATLCLYTNLPQICFQIKAAEAKIASRSCDILESTELRSISINLRSHDNGSDSVHSNTAIIYVNGEDLISADGDPIEESGDSNKLLWQGVDLALVVEPSAYTLIFRHNFMSNLEARNFGATLSSTLDAFLETKSPKLFKDLKISQQDLQNILEWNKIDFIPKKSLVHAEFSKVADSQPDAEAIDSWDGQMTYRELDHVSADISRELRRRGVGVGSWVLVCFHKSRWSIASMLAVLKTGAAFVPVDPRFPESRIRQIIDVTKASHAVVAEGGLAALLKGSSSELQVVQVTRLSVQGPSTDEHVENLLPQPQDPAICLFTSGSTGIPKGIVASHAAVCTGAWEFGRIGNANPAERMLQFASYTFDMSYADIVTALLHGSTLCIPSEDDRMGNLQEFIQRSRPTWANLTPTVARLLDPAVCSGTIRKLLLAGELVKESDIAGWIDGGAEVYNVYGPAENVLILNFGRIFKGAAYNTTRPRNTRVWIADMDKRRLMPVGAIGELISEGSQVADGYLNDPTRTAASFLVDVDLFPNPTPEQSSPRRFYRTGDLARQFADGSFEVIGRADSQVKVGGQRIELSDIEAHIKSCRAAVVLPKKGPLANRLTAILHTQRTPDADNSYFTPLDPALVEETRKKLGESLPPYMVPSHWLGIDKFPYSTSSKLDRKLLLNEVEILSQEQLMHLTQIEENLEAQQTISLNEGQKLLQEICSQVLNLPMDRVIMTHSFTRLGGDSITAMQVSSATRRAGVGFLSVKHILTSTSLLDVAGQISEQTSSQLEIPVIEAQQHFYLSPMQQFFIETAHSSSAWHHYNQNVLLRLTVAVQPQLVEKALADIIQRHPMLRARFRASSDGEWMQYITAATDSEFHLEIISDDLSRDDQKRRMLQARQALNLFDGPIVRAQLFKTSAEKDSLLFIVAHHIVIDLVSWRVIVEELEALVNALIEADSQAIAPILQDRSQSIPFSAWAELQRRHSQRLIPAQTIPYGLSVPDTDFSFWGISPSQNVYSDVQEIRIALDPTLASQFLYDCHRALRTEPVDLLLASIFISFRKVFPECALPPIFNESHGREPWNDQIDISQTVGWFTVVSPILLENVNTDDVVDVVRRVKDWRRAMPAKGYQYFSSKYLTEEGRSAYKNHLPAEILFNYEGRYQSLEKEDAILKPESWTAGEELADMGPNLQRFCLFELSAAVLSDGKLHLTSAWNSKTRHQSRISSWLESVLPSVLQHIVGSLLNEREQLTLDDVGKRSTMDYLEIDSLEQTILAIPEVENLCDVEAILDGSPMQDSLALSQLKTTNLDAYEIDFTWEVTTDQTEGASRSIDSDQLLAAWRETVAAHSPLRTVFLESASATGSDMIYQIVLKKHVPCSVLLKAENSEDALQQLNGYTLYRDQGLFPDRKPPHRLLICSTSDKRTFVRFQVNHILFDGMSQKPLLQSLSRAYSKVVLASDSTRNTFGDFIHYIRDPERRNRSLLYWKDHLNGVKPCFFPHLLDTRMDQESPKSQKPQRCHAPVPLEVKLSELQRVAGSLQITIPTLVHLAWALVLRLYTGENHAVFGYLASGRDAPLDGIEDAIGPFIAMLVCFVDFGHALKSSLVELMKRMQESSADAIAHQGTSLAEIQSAIELPGNSLLFNSGISFLPNLSRQSQIDRGQDLIFETITEKDPTEFDLSLFVEVNDFDGEIKMHFDFLGSAFGSEHIKNVAGSLSHMLSELVRDPYQSLRDILKPGKRDMVSLLQWNNPLITPLEKCAHEIFAERVRAYPDREAIYSWDGIMTYKQLDDVSTCLGRHLLQYGIGPEILVPVCFEKSLWTVVAILGILKAGGAFVLLDPAHPEARLWNLINELEASVVVCSPLTAESRSFKLRAATESRTISIIEIGQGLVDQLLSSGQRELGNAPIYESVNPENLMYAVFTSGTTGTPKGTLITHRALATGLREHAVATGMTLLGPDTRSLQFASYSFDASIGDIFTTIEVGGCLCIPREEDRSPVEVTTFVARSRATWAGITPSFAALLDPLSVSTLKALCLAGEPLSVSQVNAWASRLQLINMYGPTECTVACVSHSAVTRETGASNIGRGYRCATWIVDENDHSILRPIGAVGELLIEGPILARGYLKRPETTAAVFIDSPEWLKGVRPNSKLYKTGDLVRYNSDGTLNFIGRKDTQIKINGQRVEVGEIETVLSTSLERDDGPIVVDLLKRASLGESDILVCFVCVRPDSEVSKEASASDELIPIDADSIEKLRSVVAKILRQPSTVSSLPRYMLPQAYIPINKIPLSTSGKTDRRALQVATSALARAQLVGYTAALTISTDGDDLDTDEEVLLGKLWEKVLNVQVISKRSNFYNLGGDSVIAMRLRAECRRVGIDLSIAEIFANPDLIDMANLLASTPTTISSTASSNLVSSSASTICEDSCSEPFSLVRQLDIKFDDESLQAISAECSLSVEDIEDIYPCSPMQEALMAISSSKSKQQAYCLHAAFTLPPEMDIPRFLLAWEQTSARFAMMRSRIILRPYGSFIVVSRSALAAYSVTGKSCADQMASQRTQAFSYGSPLLRLGIVSGEQGNPSSFIISVHHAAYDGWSMRLIWDTVIRFFRGAPGATHPSPSFQSFIRELNVKSTRPSEDYWRNQLIRQDENGFKWPPVASSHKPSASSSKVFQFYYSAQTSRNLSVTAADLVNAVWAMTLAGYSDSALVSYGVTLSGRDIALPDIEEIVGPTIATVPRQIEVRHDMSLADYLQSLQQVINSAIPHQHLGLQNIQSLSPAAREACNFNTLLVVTPGSVTENSHLNELGIVPLPIDSADFHPYPLVLECSIDDGSLSIEAAFDPHCIDELTLILAMQQFDHILRNVSQCTSNSSPSDIGSLMDPAPNHINAILNFNSGKPNDFVPIFVHQIVEQTAYEQPSDMAVISHDAILTYQQLDKFANILAQDIHERKPYNNESCFVGLCIDKSAAALVSMLAILKAGCAFVPLDPTQPASRLEALVDTAKVEIILTSPSHTKYLSDLFADRCVLPVEPKGVEIDHAAWSSAIAFQKDYFKLNRTTRMLQFSNFTFDVSLFEIFTTLAAGGCVCVPSEQARMDDLTASILEMKVNVLSLTPTVARLLDGGKLPIVKLVVFAGETLSQSDIDAWAQPGRRIVNAYGPTEACIYATARDIVQGVRQKSSRNIGKGLGVDVWVMRPESNTLVPIGAVGELCVSGQQLARGYHSMEEATLRSFSTESFSTALGSTRTARIYRTGDLVRYESDGSLEFLGRRDGQIKIRGQRIDVGEVQHHIQKSMATDKLFRHCTVQLCNPSSDDLQLRSAKTDPILVAFLVMEVDFVDALSGVRFSHLRTGSADYPNIIATKLQHSLRAVLPAFMVPSIFIALDRLPNTASGKLDRGFIATCLGSLNFESPNSNDREILHPLNAREDMLRDWWERLLGVDKNLVTVNSDFFSLGGNSLSAIKLVSLARSLGYETTFSAIFSNPLLSDMATHIEPTPEDAAAAELPLSVLTSAQFDLISETEAESVINYTLPTYGIDYEDVEDIYPATPMQESSMALTARTPYAWLMIAHMDIPASDLAMLKRSWESAFQGFELLRTRMIPGQDSGALQVVMKSGALTWEEVPDIETFANIVYDTHDYGQPLARVGLVKAASSLQGAKDTSGTVTVLFSASHGLYDGWSLRPIWSRLFFSPSTEYHDDSSDRATPFKEFIRYQTALDPADAITFWQRKLQGAPGAEFPGKPADIAASYMPMASWSIKQKLSLPAPDVIRQSGATVATIAQAAWALTVGHFTGSNDVIFRTILSGRATAAASVPGIEEMTGPTAAFIPCRTRIDYSLSISSFLAQCQNDNLEAIPHAHIGWERISRINEDCNKACKLHNLFNFQAVAFDNLDAQAAGLYSPKVYENPKGLSPNALDVDLVTLIGGKEILVTFSYDPIILHSSQVESIMATFITLVEQMFHKPSSTPVGDLSALSQSHMETLQPQQVGFNGGSDANVASSGSYIQHLVRQHVDRNPFHHAVESLHDCMTYMQLEDYSNSLAERLVRQGVRSNQAIGLVLDKSSWAIVAILGVLKAGGYLVPFDPSTNSSSLPGLLHHAKTSTVLVSPAYASSFSDVSGCRCIVVAADTLPVPTTAFLKPAYRSPVPSIASDYAFSLLPLSADPGSAPSFVTHGELRAALLQVGKQMTMNTKTRSLLYNESWSTTMLVDILAPLAHGGTICCPSLGSSISDIGESIKSFNVNAVTIPVAVSRILKPKDMPALRQVCLYGDIPTRHDVAQWSQCARLFLAWGVAEMGTIAFLGSPSQSQHGEFVGTATWTCASVVNPHNFSERVPPGAIGILKLGHSNLSSARAGQIKTEGPQRFRANVDRTLSLIESAAERKLTVNGHRIKIRDIEEAIRRHLPSFSDVVVDLYAPQALGDDLRLGAVVTASSPAPWTSEQGAAANLAGQLSTTLQPKLDTSLPPTSIPSFFTTLLAFPLTTAGQLDRSRLQELVRNAPADSLAIYPETQDDDASLSSSERLLASLWIKTLDLDPATKLSKHDQFFDDWSGNSLLALRLGAELKRHNWLLRVPTMFDHPTLGAMAAAMQPDGSSSQ
ncbi:HC-toxin synthetase [Dothidotthia symphoricarpi CBS 119687]|uniref:HC-toxin synthetase n=1 Tax=Dothidotthia symphoricarpi CBS 119687 TaxID=1392245 RepID=A0A6A6A5S8_9PLEO|nr:HC-toxin synthetase [Dothidotthia symphoricarpi CBS 119687]KAF2125961.1 HC-toxin synthetase [Dothidotthia symphoricarpi CBS 119687]